jgi:tetratricopeptide (TPR) repeat protein
MEPFVVKSSADADEMLRTTADRLAQRPGDDAAHEVRARAFLALGQLADAQQHAAAAVRLDPDEVRYRELLAEILAASGRQRDAALEYARLGRNDPRQVAWALAEAEAWLAAGDGEQAVEAARQAIRLDPAIADGQLVLARGLIRIGDAPGALGAASRAAEARPGDLSAREVIADAEWLAGRHVEAFIGFAQLAGASSGQDRSRIAAKARALYGQRAGWLGRVMVALPPLFVFALRRGWLTVR